LRISRYVPPVFVTGCGIVVKDAKEQKEKEEALEMEALLVKCNLGNYSRQALGKCGTTDYAM